MDQAMSPTATPTELRPPGEGPYVLETSILPTNMLLLPPIATSQAYGTHMGIVAAGMAYAAPVPLLHEPARTMPCIQYPIQTTIVTMNIFPDRGKSSPVGNLFKVAAKNGSVLPSDSESCGYDNASQRNDAPQRNLGRGPPPAIVPDVCDGNALARNRQGRSPRPTNNIRSANSTFIQQTHTHDSFAKLIAKPPHLDAFTPTCCPPTHWAFTNAGRMLVWMIIDPTNQIQQPLLRVVFSSVLTCHTVCQVTMSPPGSAEGGRLDMMVGFNSGDILW